MTTDADVMSLDEQVAREVMGLEPMSPDGACPKCGHQARQHSGGDFCRDCFVVPGLAMDEHSRATRCGDYDWDYAARYSTTGDGMIFVLERMRELGWHFNLLAMPDVEPLTAQFWRNADDATISLDAPTLPEAVARAALAAVRTSGS